MSVRQTVINEIAEGKDLQAIIDSSLELYRPIIWPQFFTIKNVRTLKWETLIGESGPGAAASVVEYNTSAPLRSRKTIKKLSGDIPSMREKFKMDENDLIEYGILRQMANADEDALLDLVFDHIRMAGEAPHKRLDYFTLEALSTGKATLTVNNNPDGLVWDVAVDFGMPAGNKFGAKADLWSNSETCDPIKDFEEVMNYAAGKGHKLTKARMTRTAWNNFRASKAVREAVNGWALGAGVAQVNVNLKLVNEFLAGEQLPIISIVDASIGIEKKGVITNVNPWSTYNVSFVVDDNLGQMFNGPVAERMFPEKTVTYAEYEGVLIKRWGETDPISEFTGCEMNAFPTWKSVDKCYLLNTNKVGSFA